MTVDGLSAFSHIRKNKNTDFTTYTFEERKINRKILILKGLIRKEYAPISLSQSEIDH